MVGLIVRLRFAMWRTAMTRSPLHLVSSILGGLAALGVLALLGPGLLLLSQRPLRITALTVPLFAVITLMWTVLSLIATGVDSILDPVIQQWDSTPPQGRGAFWKLRRARPLDASLPMGDRERQAMVAGLSCSRGTNWVPSACRSASMARTRR